MWRFIIDAKSCRCLVLFFVLFNIFLSYYYFKLSEIMIFRVNKANMLTTVQNFNEQTGIKMDIFKDTLDQAHPAILEYIRKNHLIPPSKDKYNLNEIISKMTYPLHDQLNNKIREIFGTKKNGVFVECGALDGEMYSHTLFLETQLNWTGILIEGSRILIDQLKGKNRKAFVSDTCLGSVPEKMVFLAHRGQDIFNKGNGKLMPIEKYGKPLYYQGDTYESLGTVDCFPLFSILAAANLTTVDYFSLDVEGHEYHILEAIPFHRVDIKYIGVEHWIAPEGKIAIRNLMEKSGYNLIFEIESDYIFQRNATFFG